MYGLVLEGGGAKGAYQVGAIKALVEMGYEFSAVTGTSIGAINGAFFACHKLDEIYEIWEEGEITRVINTDKKLLKKILDFDFSSKDIFQIFEYLIDLINNGGFDITPLRNLLKEKIDEEFIRQSEIDFGLVTVSFTDFEPLEVFIDDIPEGRLIDYIIASASLPIFKLKKIDGKSYLDGGFYNNIPINLVAKKQLKDIIVIETEGIGRKKKIDETDLNIIRIRPSRKVARTIEVDPKIMKDNLRLGYLDAKRVINKYRSKNYYIEMNQPESEFIKELLSLNQEQLKQVFELFNFEGLVNYRNLFEHIIPMLSNILKIDDESPYDIIFLALHEQIASALNIESLELYTYKEFSEKIKSIFDFESEIAFSQKYKYIPFKFLPKQFDVLPREAREKILMAFYKIIYS